MKHLHRFVRRAAAFVLAAALDRVRQLELAAQEDGGHLGYQDAMAPDLLTFCRMTKLPAAPNALSDVGYIFTLYMISVSL